MKPHAEIVDLTGQSCGWSTSGLSIDNTPTCMWEVTWNNLLIFTDIDISEKNTRWQVWFWLLAVIFLKKSAFYRKLNTCIWYRIAVRRKFSTISTPGWRNGVMVVFDFFDSRCIYCPAREMFYGVIIVLRRYDCIVREHIIITVIITDFTLRFCCLSINTYFACPDISEFSEEILKNLPQIFIMWVDIVVQFLKGQRSNVKVIARTWKFSA